MAKATALTGTGGNVAMGDHVCTFQSWRATLTVENLNTTAFQDGGWKDFEAIGAQIVGDAVGVISTTAFAPSAIFAATLGVAEFEETVTLTVASGKTLSFTAGITATELERAEEGQNSSVCRFRFASKGQVTLTWT